MNGIDFGQGVTVGFLLAVLAWLLLMLCGYQVVTELHRAPQPMPTPTVVES